VLLLVCCRRSSDIDLVVGEPTVVIAACVSLVAGIWFDHFAFSAHDRHVPTTSPTDTSTGVARTIRKGWHGETPVTERALDTPEGGDIT